MWHCYTNVPVCSGAAPLLTAIDWGPSRTPLSGGQKVAPLSPESIAARRILTHAIYMLDFQEGTKNKEVMSSPAPLEYAIVFGLL